MWAHPLLSSQGILVAACLVCGGNGEHNISGCRSTQSSFTPSHFLSSQMEQCVCSRVLTASQLPSGGPQDCRSHLPAVAEPAEGWAARQAPGAHANCRLSGCWGEGEGLSPDHQDHSLFSKGLQRPTTHGFLLSMISASTWPCSTSENNL